MFLKLGTDPSGSTVKRGSQGFAECVLLSHGDYVPISYGTTCGKCHKGTLNFGHDDVCAELMWYSNTLRRYSPYSNGKHVNCRVNLFQSQLYRSYICFKIIESTLLHVSAKFITLLLILK
jgi:hypothetical protein